MVKPITDVCEMCKGNVFQKMRPCVDGDRPYSHKQVNKANAVIAVTGNNGEVSYFENKENYAKYVKNSEHKKMKPQ